MRTTFFLFAGLVAIAAAGAGCCDCPTACESGCNPPCDPGQVCVGGICVTADAGTDVPDAVPDVETEAEADVPPADVPDVAEDEASAEDVGGGENNVGEPCSAPSDCHAPASVSEVLCLTTMMVFGRAFEWPNGYCSGTCDPGAPDSCGDGTICISVPILGWTGCARRCEPGTPGQCRELEGYACLDPASIYPIVLDAPVCAPSF
jgi:hypothetical protein